MKKKIFIVILFVIMFLLTGCDSENDVKNNLNEISNKQVFAEEKTVKRLIADFNGNVGTGDSELYFASDEFSTIKDDSYYYELIDGIFLVVKPVEFTNDKENDIVEYMSIYVNKDDIQEEAIAYTKFLIKANYKEFTDEEIDMLLEEVKAKSDDINKINHNEIFNRKDNTLLGNTRDKFNKKEKINDSKGILVKYISNSDNYQYQVKRLYE